MAWLAANWFWVVVGIAFVAMHMFGHGGHGGHRGHGAANRQRSGGNKDGDAVQERVVNTTAGGHQH